MKNENNKALDILVSKITSIVNNAVANLKYDKTFQATIWGINDDGTYKINYLGKTYNVPNALPSTLSLGQKVQVSIPSGVFRNMYISGAPGATVMSTGEGGTSSHEHTNKTVLDGITSALVTKWNSAFSHISDAVKHITSDERNLWNTVSDKAESNHTHDNATQSNNGFMSSSDKTKLDGIAVGAQVNIQADWNVIDTSSDAYIKNKPTIPDAYDDTILVETIESIESSLSSKADINHTHDEYLTEHQDISGKSDVGHTHTLDDIIDYETPDLSDYALKSEIPSTTGFVTETVLSTTLADYAKSADIVEYDDTALTERVSEVETALTSKADKTEIPDVSNFVEKEAGKGLFSGSYDDLSNKPAIPSIDGLVSENTLTSTLADYAKSDDIPTETERTNWNSAYTHSTATHAPSNAEENVIETVKVNGTALTPISKAVDITVPTMMSQLTNNMGYKTTDSNTTYTLTKSGSTITLTGSDGSTTSVTDSDNNTVYTHPTTSGYKHIPSGGSSGQVLKWSADGTAVWADENSGTNEIISSTEPTGQSVGSYWLQEY